MGKNGIDVDKDTTKTLDDELHFPDSEILEMDELKDCGLPVLLYGGGSYARDVLDYYAGTGITWSGIFADHVSPEIMVDYGLKEIKMDAIDFPCVVVMGMAQYHKGKELAERNANIRKVHYPVLMPYRGKTGFGREEIMELLPEYRKTYGLLADGLSQKCMAAFLNAGMNRDATYIFDCFEQEENYFDNSVFRVREGENYIDVGAYTGDTIKLFTENCGGRIGKIWAFEADRKLEPVIRKTAGVCGVVDNTELFMIGLWNKKSTLYFNRADYNAEEGLVGESGTGNAFWLEVDTLDHLLADRKLSADILKINFLDAGKVLEGARELIRTDRPKLAVVVAFGNRMVAEIPQLVRRLEPAYKIYLRYNAPMPAKLVMYAIADA